MKILVTGGLWYIGSHTIVELENQWHKTVIVDNGLHAQPNVYEKLLQLTGEKIPLYKGDVRDGEILDLIFKEQKPDAVIHFAALKSVAESCEKPFEYYDNNINGSIKLLEVMEKNNCRIMLFSSSCTVYDPTEKAPFDENSKTGNTGSPYGTTKLIMEQIIRDICMQKAMKALSLRYFNPIGAHVSWLIGEYIPWKPSYLVPYIFKVIKGELKKITIFWWDWPTRDGTAIRDYIHIMDVAQGHCDALQYLQWQKEWLYETINFWTKHGTTVLEMIKAVETTLWKKVNYEIWPRRSGDVAIAIANPKKAHEKLAWKNRFSIQDAIIHTEKFLKTMD